MKSGCVESLPAKRVDRERARCVLSRGAEINRVNAAATEGFDKGDAVVVAVVADEVKVGGDEGAQELEECHVNWWQVVDRADAHVEDMAGGLSRLVGKSAHEVRVNRAASKYARPTRVNTQQVRDARLVNGDEGVEDSGDKDSPARVRREAVLQV